MDGASYSFQLIIMLLDLPLQLLQRVIQIGGICLLLGTT